MKYTIITGGLSNKGLQAMAFDAITRLVELRPDGQIAFFAQDYERVRNIRDNLRFEVLPWKLLMKLACLGWAGRGLAFAWGWIFHRDWRGDLERVVTILHQADLAMDISGFALSSQWPFLNSLKYLMHIAVMKRYGIKIYLLPQSFGPFDYNPLAKAILLPLLRKYLRYPARIYAREEEGFKALQRFSLGNLVRSPDLVLLGKAIDLGQIYKAPPHSQVSRLRIPPGSVGIIPNIRVMQHGKAGKLLEIYRSIVSYLLQDGRHVYVLWHSRVDRRAWESLHRRIAPHPRLIFLDLDLDCVEVVELLARFAIVVPARYHASVHAFKAGTPALVFGWSAKYRELMNLLAQEQYLFDVRARINADEVLTALEALLAGRAHEAETIRAGLARLRGERDVFREVLSDQPL